MKVIAVTGGIACGKSTVTKEMAQIPNVRIVDADLIARQALAVGSPPYLKLRSMLKSNEKYRDQFSRLFHEEEEDQATTQQLGSELKGTVNRELLGKFVFADEQLRRQLNHITHSWIQKQIIMQILSEWRQHMFNTDRVVVMDIPLLFEAGYIYRFIASKVICVTTTSDLELRWLMKRNNLSETDAMNRIRSQMPLAVKEQKSDYVIRNTGSLSDLQSETRRVFMKCKREASSFGSRTMKCAGLAAGVAGGLWYLNSRL